MRVRRSLNVKPRARPIVDLLVHLAQLLGRAAVPAGQVLRMGLRPAAPCRG